MNDGSDFTDEDLEPLEIDVRSPGERWAESGREGFDRLQGRIAEARLDSVAVAWMLLVLAFTGIQIYNAFQLDSFGTVPGRTQWWSRLTFLSQTGGFLVIFGGLAAIVMAVWFDTPAARLTLRLAMIGSAWAVITAMFGIAVAFHVEGNGTEFTSSGEDKYVQALSAAAIGGLGLVMGFIAWRMNARPTASDEYADPDLVELS